MTTQKPFHCENCETYVESGLEIHLDILGPFVTCPICDCTQDTDEPFSPLGVSTSHLS